jgi:hypothetical protein
LTTTINASTSSGLVNTADTSGILQLQTASTAALTIDANQRTAFVAGTAALPAITTAGDTNTGIFFPTADTIAFSEGGAESMRIDASGNVGIGITPSAWTSASVAQLGARGSVWYYSGDSMHMSLNAYSVAGVDKYIQTDTAADYYQYAGGHFFRYAASGTAGNNISWTTGMALDSSGNLLVGTTSANVGFTTGAKSLCFNSDYGGSYPVAINHSVSGNGYFLGFGRGGSQCGYIWTNGSNSTQYVTSSDYRLKENIVPMTGALAKVSALKPVTYTWKEDGTSSQGFIAHELQEIVPEAVAGDKDALNEDGSIKPQGIDTSFLVATLTAALQETKALIDTQAETINALTARIVALETK